MECCPEQEQFRLIIQGISRAIISLEREQVVCYGLTPQQAYTLDIISSTDGITMTTLSERLGVSTSTMTRNIEKLEQEGVVTRERAFDDNRSVTVRLTDAGGVRLAMVHECYASYYGEILGALTEDEREVVLKGLTLLNKALQSCCGK